MNARAETAVYTAAAIIVPALSGLAPRATVPVLVAAALGIAGLRARGREWPSVPSVSILIGFAVLIGWAALSNAWSIEPSWRRPAALLGSLLAGLWLIACASGKKEPLRNALALGLGLGLLVYAFEAVSGAWVTRAVHGLAWPDIIDDLTGGISVRAHLINGTVILSLLLWPAMNALLRHGHRTLAAGLALLVAAAVGYYGSDTGLLALIVGACAWAAASWLGARAARIAAALFIVFMLATPLVVQRALEPLDVGKAMIEHPKLPQSAFVRLFIWKFAAERIAERPVIGWGFDMARRIPGGGDAFIVRDAEGNAVLKELYLPLHPHNQVLQIWLELGLVGALIAAALGGSIIWRIGAMAPPDQGAALAFAATVVCYAALSFGAWQSWWIAAVLLGAAFIAATRAGAAVKKGTTSRPP